MRLANHRALFSLTVEELLLGENISDAEWYAIYRPAADRPEDRSPAIEGGQIGDAIPGAGRVAGTGEVPRGTHVQDAQS